MTVAGIRNRPFFEDGLIERQYIIRDKKHMMLSGKLSNMQNGILSNCLSIVKRDSCVNLNLYFSLNFS